jgi:hypothetical protein
MDESVQKIETDWKNSKDPDSLKSCYDGLYATVDLIKLMNPKDVDRVLHAKEAASRWLRRVFQHPEYQELLKQFRGNEPDDYLLQDFFDDFFDDFKVALADLRNNTGEDLLDHYMHNEGADLINNVLRMNVYQHWNAVEAEQGAWVIYRPNVDAAGWDPLVVYPKENDLTMDNLGNWTLTEEFIINYTRESYLRVILPRIILRVGVEVEVFPGHIMGYRKCNPPLEHGIERPISTYLGCWNLGNIKWAFKKHYGVEDLDPQLVIVSKFMFELLKKKREYRDSVYSFYWNRYDAAPQDPPVYAPPQGPPPPYGAALKAAGAPPQGPPPPYGAALKAAGAPPQGQQPVPAVGNLPGGRRIRAVWGGGGIKRKRTKRRKKNKQRRLSHKRKQSKKRKSKKRRYTKRR